MNLNKYSVVSDNNHEVHEFLSEGPNGTIKKVVYYQEIDTNIFNLAFGDWDEAEQRINDQARTNNNDRDKVLATVASTVVDFMKHHPKVILFAKEAHTEEQSSTRLELQITGLTLVNCLILKDFTERIGNLLSKTGITTCVPEKAWIAQVL